MSLHWHNGNLDGHGITMEVMHGRSGIPLTIVRPYRMGVIPSMALDMCGSLHLFIPYLLKGETRRLRV